jgi:23S rRNA (uracil1939-C5)-methyltransferase
MAQRRLPPVYETEILDLDARGHGVGIAPDGRLVHVRPAAPGSRIRVAAAGRKKGAWAGRRLAMIRPPADAATPPCPVFGVCGGCTLQELTVDAQRRFKQAAAVRAILGAAGDGVVVHPLRAAAAWGYRNKVELSFGTQRYLTEDEQNSGVDRVGRFLGFHAPGRFDRVVDTTACHLISDDANRLLATVRRLCLAEDAPPPRDPRSKQGFWRHAMLREAPTTGELLVTMFTTSPDAAAEATLEALADALQATELRHSRLVGVEWTVDDGLADVARGDTRRVWGRPWLEERVGGVTLRLSRQSFFQTNTAGAVVLFDTIGEAVGRGGTLLDLYCGAGTIGLYLASQVERLIGVELVAEAVEEARAAAARHGVAGEWHRGALEDLLDVVTASPSPRRVVVDPPRVGLHPRAVATLAELDADVLVYVACYPPSLGRDRAILEAGGWRLTDVWTVDLFPQTHHVEAVGRFVRTRPAAPAEPPTRSPT